MKKNTSRHGRCAEHSVFAKVQENYIRTKIPDFALYIDVVLINDKTQIKHIRLSMNDSVAYLEQNEHHHHLI